MFINEALEKIQSSKLKNFFSDSLIFKNIDGISFILLLLTIVSTSFMQTGAIGLFAILFTASCVFKLLFKSEEKIGISFVNKILIVYFLIVLISVFGASYFLLSIKGILKTFIYLSFYFSCAYFLLENKNKILPVIFTILCTTSIESIMGILQNIAHVEEIATWQDTTNVSDPAHLISRAYGTLKPYNPNLLAGYLIAGLSSVAVFFSLAYIKKHKKLTLLFAILFFITFFAVFVTGSRGAYLGLFGFIAASSFFLYKILKSKFGQIRNIKKKYKIAFASFIVFCTGLVFCIPAFRNRIFSIFALRGDSSISFRLNVYEACSKMFMDNKILGIGVGNQNFREIYGLYMKTGFDALGAYCVPLEIAVESGIFALIAFVVFLIATILKGLNYLKNSDNKTEEKIITASCILTIFATMGHGLFDTIFFRPQVQILFWINIAILHSLTTSKEDMIRLAKTA